MCNISKIVKRPTLRRLRKNLEDDWHKLSFHPGDCRWLLLLIDWLCSNFALLLEDSPLHLLVVLTPDIACRRSSMFTAWHYLRFSLLIRTLHIFPTEIFLARIQHHHPISTSSSPSLVLRFWMVFFRVYSSLSSWPFLFGSSASLARPL